MKKLQLSVIIVHYNNARDLFECLESIYKYRSNIKFEIILVDNSLRKMIFSSIKEKYKDVKYISSPKNLGYGGGINLGAKHAKGDFLFVLNPDVIFKEEIFETLVKKIVNDIKIGIIAPLLYSTNGKIMEQGAKELTPKRAIFKLSFIDKLFPHNSISKNYWVNSWDTKKLTYVDNIPGTAFIIRRKLFETIGGFDEHFFLYFEEFDLCKKVRNLGYKICIDPAAKLIHKWGTSTKKLSNINDIFVKSRFYYFRKNYGLLKALFVEIFLRTNIYILLFIPILFWGIFIRFFEIDKYIDFIGDQAWFFISARDMVLNHSLPLVGIASSHLWLHQGPLWTYIIALLFLLSKFNPFVPYYFTSALDCLAIIFLFYVVSKMFSSKVAFFTSLIYAFSPAVILNARFAYHTSPIPIFVILLIYSIYSFIKGKVYFFPITIFLLFILYNFELQNSIFLALFAIIILYGFINKKSWFKNIFKYKIIIFSLIAFFLPMLPILIYDIKNGFPQTIVFGGWIVYKFTSFPLGLFVGKSNSYLDYSPILNYLSTFIQKLLFVKTIIISLSVFVISLIYLILINFKKRDTKLILLLLIIVFAVGGILITKTPSDAYLPSLFVPIIICVAVFLEKISFNRVGFVIILIFLTTLTLFNLQNIILSKYYLSKGITMQDRIKTANFFIKDSKNKSFSIVGNGIGSEFASFTMNYQFLAWYYGKEPVNKGKIVYIVSEELGKVKIVKK